MWRAPVTMMAQQKAAGPGSCSQLPHGLLLEQQTSCSRVLLGSAAEKGMPSMQKCGPSALYLCGRLVLLP